MFPKTENYLQSLYISALATMLSRVVLTVSTYLVKELSPGVGTMKIQVAEAEKGVGKLPSCFQKDHVE